MKETLWTISGLGMWYQWEGKRKRRNLWYSGYVKRGTPLVQIAFEADTSVRKKSEKTS